jgi:hypothetical protein
MPFSLRAGCGVALLTELPALIERNRYRLRECCLTKTKQYDETYEQLEQPMPLSTLPEP